MRRHCARAILMPGAIVIVAAVDACEQPVLERAAAILQEALAACGAEGATVSLTFVDSLSAVAREPVPAFVVASLLPELAGSEPVAAVDARWRAAVAALPATFPPVLICTIFRHVDPSLDHVRREALRERILRLSLAAMEISHDTGANVIDFDRTLAHVGGRVLASDCRFASETAIEVGARALVRGMLALARDESIPPGVATYAETRIGEPWDVPALRT